MTTLANLTWQRQNLPLLSALTTKQKWASVTLYSPAVIRHEERWLMWFVGNCSQTRTSDMQIGHAESTDGIRWSLHPANPVLTSTDIPAGFGGGAWQTPHVMFDDSEGLFKMWFVIANIQRRDDGSIQWFSQQLGYADSTDGISWRIHPEPLYPSARGPCVLKTGPNAYQMWAGSSPRHEGPISDLVGHIYRFDSVDGIEWTRSDRPAIVASSPLQSVVYPFVLRRDDRYVMWYGGHVEDERIFEIYCSTSTDGSTWTNHHDQPVLAATRNPNDFDGRYTSTPCVVDDDSRWLLYYSARDCGNLYVAGDNTIRADGAGIYRHIGVAICPKNNAAL